MSWGDIEMKYEKKVETTHGLFVWTVGLEEFWDYQSDGEDFDDIGREYKISASTAQEAEEKAVSLALGCSYYDDEANRHNRLIKARVIKMVREFGLDA